MADDLKSKLPCPVCGKVVIGVFHHWSDVAEFEYHHEEDVELEKAGFEPKPCIQKMSIEEGNRLMEAQTEP